MKKIAAVVTAAMAMAALAAGPASADEIDLDGDELLFLGYPAYSVIDDVDYENVRERNHKDGTASWRTSTVTASWPSTSSPASTNTRQLSSFAVSWGHRRLPE